MAGDFDEIFAAVRTLIEGGFTALPIRYPNDDRDPDVNGFVYVEIAVIDEKPVSLGPIGEQWRRDYHELRVYVNVPRGTLIGTAEAHAKQIRSLFGVESVAGAKVTSKTVGVGAGVDSSLGQFWSVPLTIRLFADRKE